jgi:hypothetical protein
MSGLWDVGVLPSLGEWYKVMIEYAFVFLSVLSRMLLYYFP